MSHVFIQLSKTLLVKDEYVFPLVYGGTFFVYQVSQGLWSTKENTNALPKK